VVALILLGQDEPTHEDMNTALHKVHTTGYTTLLLIYALCHLALIYVITMRAFKTLPCSPHTLRGCTHLVTRTS